MTVARTDGHEVARGPRASLVDDARFQRQKLGNEATALFGVKLMSDAEMARTEAEELTLTCGPGSKGNRPLGGSDHWADRIEAFRAREEPPLIDPINPF